jgi:hypothetical protein
VLALYRDLLRLRRAHPALADCRKDLTRATSCEAPRWLCVVRADPSGDAALVVASFGAEPTPIAIAESGTWDLALWTDDPAYGEATDEQRSPRGPAGAGAERCDGASARPHGRPPDVLATPATLTLPSWSAALYLRRGAG